MNKLKEIDEAQETEAVQEKNVIKKECQEKLNQINKNIDHKIEYAKYIVIEMLEYFANKFAPDKYRPYTCKQSINDVLHKHCMFPNHKILLLPTEQNEDTIKEFVQKLDEFDLDMNYLGQYCATYQNMIFEILSTMDAHGISYDKMDITAHMENFENTLEKYETMMEFLKQPVGKRIKEKHIMVESVFARYNRAKSYGQNTETFDFDCFHEQSLICSNKKE